MFESSLKGGLILYLVFDPFFGMIKNRNHAGLGGEAWQYRLPLETWIRISIRKRCNLN